MMKILALVTIASFFMAACRNEENKNNLAATDTFKAELLALNQRYDSALVNADTVSLSKIYAAEFSYTTPEGQVRSKSGQLAYITNGGLKLEVGKSDEVDIKLYDSTAVLTGRFMGKGTFAQNFVDIQERYTTVWVRQDGKWVLVKEQGTFIKP